LRKAKIITKQGLKFSILWSFAFSSFVCLSQTFEDMGYRGELTRWNYFPIDSIWSFYPGNETDVTEFDNSIEKISIIPQDIGRVESRNKRRRRF